MNFVRTNIQAMGGYVPGEQPRDRQYTKLNTNENPYPPSPAVLEALHDFAFDRLRLYPDPVCTRLREKAAQLSGLDSPDWILCGNGSDDLLTMAVRTFVDQGAAMACFSPSYSLYPVLAEIQGADCIEIPLRTDFSIPDDYAELSRDASLFFVARPNAPTGNAFAVDKMRELCRTFNGVVWIDEAYADFADDNCLELVKEFENVVVSRTLSKSYSLAGIRLGLAYSRPETVAQMMKAKDSYNVSMLTQVAGLAALTDQAYMQSITKRVRKTRSRTAAELLAMGFEVLPSQSNFLFCRPPIQAREYFGALREEGILVRYFSGERTRDYVRITIGTDAEMDQLLSTTAKILSEQAGC